HANVQRGLAAAPFAIPAPGGNRPMRADFFSRSKTIHLAVRVVAGLKNGGCASLTHPTMIWESTAYPASQSSLLHLFPAQKIN
ncbi:hypothetical protein BS416_09590, partial [Cronobacter sakazakii]